MHMPFSGNANGSAYTCFIIEEKFMKEKAY